MAKEEKLNNLSTGFVGETLRAKAGKMPAYFINFSFLSDRDASSILSPQQSATQIKGN